MAIEIILIIITGVLTIISSLASAVAIKKSSCNDNSCVDVVLQTEPK